jgi:hypothetical protein
LAFCFTPFMTGSARSAQLCPTKRARESGQVGCRCFAFASGTIVAMFQSKQI